jgi:hypothetical protein
MARTVAVLAVLCALAAGCGGTDPHLARADVAPLIALANKIAAEGPCAQRRDLVAVRARAISLVNRKLVPADFQEPLLAGVNDLADRVVVCVPPVTTTPPAPAAGDGDAPPEHGKAKGHGKHKHGENGQ